MDETCERYAHVVARVEDAARASGREPAAVRLVAVSKFHPSSALARLAGCGQRDFGESRAQEGGAKIAALPDPAIEWHFLGPLQRNKARLIAGRFQWLHSLESLQAADTLSRHLTTSNARLRVLIEVNITGDPRKHGVAPADLFPFLEAYTSRPRIGLDLVGLMTMAPHAASEGAVRAAFAHLRELACKSRQAFGLPGFDELSMGMSDDYHWAIAEGATIVRIGRALFGERGPATAHTP